MVNSRWFLGVVFACAAGCGTAPSSTIERTASTSSPIQDGTADTTHAFAVAVIQRQGGSRAAFCSGVMLAPNLVATARHCVSDLASDKIVCNTSMFGAVVPASVMVVSTSPSVSNGPLLDVAKIVVPDGADQAKVCGNDIALLILASNVGLTGYAEPAISPPMTQYSTTVTAIGYGVDTPTDTSGASAGTRRIKENIPLTCIPDDKSFNDCFSDPTAQQVMTASEFVSGDASTCGGDSGSGVFDQGNFDQGRWVAFGVLSRGGVSSDGQTCIQPIYTRFDAWGALLVDTANEAASMGHYTTPAWASVAAGGDAGASGVDGVACTADSQCLSSNCVSVGSSPGFVCASPCVSNACPANFQCLSGFCFPGGGSPQGTPTHHGGCALSSGHPSGLSPWCILAVALALGALGRRVVLRRRRP
jgi:V8-like Glu-specific endopeptidase